MVAFHDQVAVTADAITMSMERRHAGAMAAIEERSEQDKTAALELVVMNGLRMRRCSCAEPGHVASHRCPSPAPRLAYVPASDRAALRLQPH